MIMRCIIKVEMMNLIEAFHSSSVRGHHGGVVTISLLSTKMHITMLYLVTNVISKEIYHAGINFQ